MLMVQSPFIANCSWLKSTGFLIHPLAHHRTCFSAGSRAFGRQRCALWRCRTCPSDCKGRVSEVRWSWVCLKHLGKRRPTSAKSTGLPWFSESGKFGVAWGLDKTPRVELRVLSYLLVGSYHIWLCLRWDIIYMSSPWHVLTWERQQTLTKQVIGVEGCGACWLSTS